MRESWVFSEDEGECPKLQIGLPCTLNKVGSLREGMALCDNYATHWYDHQHYAPFLHEKKCEYICACATL